MGPATAPTLPAAQFRNMKINSGTNSIVDEVRDLCDADEDSYPLADIIRRVNMGLDRVSSIIVGADRRWQWDDSNYSSEPIADADLVNGQQQYSFNDELLVLQMLVAKDKNGDRKRLFPIDKRQMRVAPEEYRTGGGTPEEYDCAGPSIYLYPWPDYDAEQGLTAYFQRVAQKFTTSDKTKEPGFASPFHDYLAFYAAEPHCMKYKQERVSWLQSMKLQREQQIAEHYTVRREYEAHGLRPAGINHR